MYWVVILTAPTLPLCALALSACGLYQTRGAAFKRHNGLANPSGRQADLGREPRGSAVASDGKSGD
eukprot:COSAG01_NODE_58367_length_306_cov_1.231884_1_plen_65_part_01